MSIINYLETVFLIMIIYTYKTTEIPYVLESGKIFYILLIIQYFKWNQQASITTPVN